MKSRIVILSVLVAGMFLSVTSASLAVSGLSSSGDAAEAQYPETVTPTGESGNPPLGEVESEEVGGGSGTPESGEAAPTDSAAPAAAQEQVVASESAGDLPFTGFAAIPVLLVGMAMFAAGMMLRRRQTD